MAFWKKLSAEELHPLFLRHAVQRVLRYLENRSSTMDINVSELLSWKNKMTKNKIEHFSINWRIVHSSCHQTLSDVAVLESYATTLK